MSLHKAPAQTGYMVSAPALWDAIAAPLDTARQWFDGKISDAEFLLSVANAFAAREEMQRRMTKA